MIKNKFGLLCLISLLALTACASQPIPSATEVPGFLMGLVHGFIAPFALIASFFSDYRMYAFPNSGVLYDLGFALGAGIFGTSTATASK